MCVVDACKTTKEDLVAAAQHLFDVLSKPRLSKIPILVLCNKQVQCGSYLLFSQAPYLLLLVLCLWPTCSLKDVAGARSPQVLMAAIEKELAALREAAGSATRLQTDEDGDAALAVIGPRVQVEGVSARGTLQPGLEMDRREVQLEAVHAWATKL
jgi:hypothetical protein